MQERPNNLAICLEDVGYQRSFKVPQFRDLEEDDSEGHGWCALLLNMPYFKVLVTTTRKISKVL